MSLCFEMVKVCVPSGYFSSLCFTPETFQWNKKIFYELLVRFYQYNAYILQESDKNLGWSLNTSTWYNKEYDRHLKSGCYQKVGSMGDVDNIKRSCRLSLQAILKEHIGVLSTNE